MFTFGHYQCTEVILKCLSCLVSAENTCTFNGSTKTRNPESGNGIPETETEMEYRIREKRSQAIDLKKIYISNDNKINKQIKKKVQMNKIN